MSNPLSIAPVRHLDRDKSWILPDAGKQWLVYVSDGSTGTIDIYNYRIRVGKLYGQITGFTFPYGQCIDRAGDVYVVDNATAKIYEFAHGATSPLATATDEYGSPIGCAVNPTTGDVAVSNFSESGSGSGAGGLDIFAGGLSGNQTDYTSSNFFRLFPPGYDPKGNLFVQAMDYSGAKYLAELPAGKTQFTLLTGLTIGFPGSVAWDGSYLAATDQDYQYNYVTAIHRFTVSGSAVTVVRTTVLTDNCYPFHNYMVAVQPFIGGPTRDQNAVVAGNLNCPNREDFFNYTNGGDPKRSLPSSIAPVAPYGQAVSRPSP